MNLKNLIKHPEIELLTSLGETDILLNGCYVGDLLSWVMSHAKTNQLWLTVQSHPNVIAISSLLELGAVIIVEGATIPNETIQKAEQEKIALLKTTLSAVDVIALYNELMNE
ncbi:MAG TPA: hypothetical protein DCY20_06185 [Firmicutes bacterium]|nr:hypothetical protein [Bacillota bacterium]